MKGRKKIIWMGLIAFWIYFILEITTDILFSSKFPGYNWKTQSLSYLGQTGSPIESWVSLWGVLFSVFLTFYTLAFYWNYQSNKWVKPAAFSLLIYALGEGIGSGCFPIDAPGTLLSLNGRLHNVFGGIGDAGIIMLPFFLMLMFPRNESRKLRSFLWVVVGAGTTMAILFLIAKYYRPNNVILTYKGVWQRTYTFNYDLMLLVISIRMLLGMKQGVSSPG
jgi:Protein of unknown function (DUF998)